MELWERIARARKAAGLSQEELGVKLGVSRQAVSKWETGQTRPDLDTVIALCRELDLSADYLLLGEEKDTAQSEPKAAADEGPGKDLSGRRYAILLTQPVETVFSRAVDLLVEKRGCSEDVATAMLEHAPTVLLRELDYEAARAASLTLKTCGCIIRVVETQYADTAQEAEISPSVDLLLPPSPAEKPMSFGMTVLAVALGVVAALLLLSIF